MHVGSPPPAEPETFAVCTLRQTDRSKALLLFVAQYSYRITNNKLRSSKKRRGATERMDARHTGALAPLSIIVECTASRQRKHTLRTSVVYSSSS